MSNYTAGRHMETDEGRQAEAEVSIDAVLYELGPKDLVEIELERQLCARHDALGAALRELSLEADHPVWRAWRMEQAVIANLIVHDRAENRLHAELLQARMELRQAVPA